VNYLDKNVLVMLSGLSVGEEMAIPSENISKAIEKLWKQGLFEDISIVATKIEGNQIYLEIRLKERPRLSKYAIKGLKKTEADKVREKISLTRGDVVTDNLLINTEYQIKEYFRSKGFLDTEVDIKQSADSSRANSVVLDLKIDKKSKVRIYEINIHNNTNLTDQKIKNTFKETKEKGTFTPLDDIEVVIVDIIKNFFRLDLNSMVENTQKHFNENVKVRLFKASKYIEDKYEEDKLSLIAKYNEHGFRDATVSKDSIYRNERNSLSIDIWVEEGNQYYFRNIDWVGNTKYSDEILSRVLKIQKGDIYNRELLESNLNFNPTETDVSSLYMDEGYLFFQANPVEVRIENDSIDLEIRLHEGKQATINKVTIKGNTRTNDHVIMREIRTLPGQLFSRSAIIRTIRELSNLRYFNPETIVPDVRPNQLDGTVDIEYSLEETSADQIELSGGWGYGRIIGTLGLSFNNFSLRNIFKFNTYKPIPSGDGQKFSVKLSSYGKGYISFSASFTEPWLGGKKPNALSLTYWYSLYSNGLPKDNPNRSTFKINGLTIGLGKRLKWPDDYFSLYQAITMQRYDLYQYSQIFAGGSGTGDYNNFSYTIALSRSSISQPFYPRNGSDVSISLEVTPPYSFFMNTDPEREASRELSQWIEYYKWKINMAYYFEVFDKMVIMTRAKFGFLGRYNQDLDITPFERFYLGGDGLSGYNNLDGREIIGMRGYINESITPYYFRDRNVGGTIYSKYTLELRYPLSLNPNSTIYLMGFLEGGNSWLSWAEFSPFAIYRTAGFGVRVFLPMFGLLGLDWGYGFDDVPGIPNANGSQFHFSINSSID